MYEAFTLTGSGGRASRVSYNVQTPIACRWAGKDAVLVALVQDQYGHRRPVIYDIEMDQFLLDTSSCARLQAVGGPAVPAVYLTACLETGRLGIPEGAWGVSRLVSACVQTSS